MGIEDVLLNEGGFVNDPDDPGGRTNFGISERAHPEAWVDDLVTKDEAIAIYRHDYLVQPGIDKLPSPLQDQVLDFAVNAGPARAVKLLQFILRCPQDGHIGPQTCAALAERDLKEVNNFYVGLRETYYRDLVRADARKGKFLKGWLTRARKFFLP